jgi:hypothetical protein
MDDVRVHRNSREPERLGALAYAQGTEIHLGPGQDGHLAHEAWHVVQQKQGRVRATAQMKGRAVNEDAGLEREADLMGERARFGPNSSGTEAAPRLPRPSTSGTAPLQMSRIISHIVEVNRSPVSQIIDFVAGQTGKNKDKVEEEMEFPVSGRNASYLQAITGPDADRKPFSVKAFIDKPTGSADRPDSCPMQTAIGHIGMMEDKLRGRTNTQYHGGHLLGYGWLSDWDVINTASNIAPQIARENTTFQKGGWALREKLGREDAAKQAKQKNWPVIVTAYCNYAGGTYTVSLGHIAKTLFSEGTVRTAINSLWLKDYRYVVLNGRVPTQYVLELTDPNPLGMERTKDNKNSAGALPTASMPTRLARQALAPLEDAILRSLAQWRSLDEGGRWGAAVVSRNQKLHFADLASEVPKLAQFAALHLVTGGVWTMPAAILALTHYFGSGSGVAALQTLTTFPGGFLGSEEAVEAANRWMSTVASYLRVDTWLDVAKKAAVDVSASVIKVGAG